MENKNLKAFIDEVNNNERLRDELIKAESNQDVIRIAGELGFSLDEADLRSPSIDVSDAELEIASGGAHATFTLLCVLKASGLNFEKTQINRYCGGRR